MKHFKHLLYICKLLIQNISIFLTLSLSYFVGCIPTPLAIYDFDSGSTQAWVASDGVLDDKGIVYKPMLFNVSHFEAAQYPNSFPGGDPLNDNKGCLLVNGFQMGPWAQNFSFPANSEFWEISVYNAGVGAKGSLLWQNLKGIKISIGDDYGATPGHITANIGVMAYIGGKETLISELDNKGNPLFHQINHQTTKKWSNISANLNVPANALVYMVIIKIRGDWKNYKTYEGAIMIDQIESIK